MPGLEQLEPVLSCKPVEPPVDEGFKINGDTLVGLEEEELDPKSVTVKDLISGEAIVTLDEHGPGALQPKQIAAPKEMSTAERERHFCCGSPAIRSSMRDMLLLQESQCTACQEP